MSNDPSDDAYDIEEEEVATGEGMPVPPGHDDANRPESDSASPED